jgi:hypothetical protein
VLHAVAPLATEDIAIATLKRAKGVPNIISLFTIVHISSDKIRQMATMHLPSEERKQDREEWNEEPKRQNDHYAGIDEFYGREPITHGLGKNVVCRGSVTEKFLGDRPRRRVGRRDL